MEARGSVRTTPTSASTSQTPRQSATLQRAQKRTSSTTSLLRSYALSSSAVEYSSAGAEGSPSEAVGIKGVSDAAIDDARGVNSFCVNLKLKFFYFVTLHRRGTIVRYLVFGT